MGASEEDVRRAIEASARKARLDADTYARKLREKPFWRFRRRQAIGKALADARLREQEAMRLLGEAADIKPAGPR